MRSEILILFVTYYKDRLKNSLDGIKKILDKLNIKYELKIINNNKENISSYKEGDNRVGEFSAWAKELNEYEITNFKTIILVNDTFNVRRIINYEIEELYKNSIIKIYKSKKAAVAGWVYKSNRIFRIGELKTNKWMGTDFIVINNNALIKLKDDFIEYVEKIANEKIDINEEKINTDIDINKNLQIRIENWIVKKGSNNWYKANEANKDLKILKIKTILLEKIFTMLVNKHKIQIINIYKININSVIIKFIKKFLTKN